jgi:hypothetical protein
VWKRGSENEGKGTTCPLTGFIGEVSKAKEGTWDDERRPDMEGEGNHRNDMLLKKMPDWSLGHLPGPS